MGISISERIKTSDRIQQPFELKRGGYRNLQLSALDGERCFCPARDQARVCISSLLIQYLTGNISPIEGNKAGKGSTRHRDEKEEGGLSSEGFCDLLTPWTRAQLPAGPKTTVRAQLKLARSAQLPFRRDCNWNSAFSS